MHLWRIGRSWETRGRIPNSSIDLSSDAKDGGAHNPLWDRRRVPAARVSRVFSARLSRDWSAKYQSLNKMRCTSTEIGLIGHQTRRSPPSPASTFIDSASPWLPRSPSFWMFPVSTSLTGWEESALRRLQTACRHAHWCHARTPPSGHSTGPARSASRGVDAATGHSPAVHPLLLLHAEPALRLHTAWGSESPTTTGFSALQRSGATTAESRGRRITPSRNRASHRNGSAGNAEAVREVGRRGPTPLPPIHGIPWLIQYNRVLVGDVYVDALIEVSLLS